MSSIFPACMLIYEALSGHLQAMETSRGLVRFRGSYADISNYGFYVTLNTLIVGYAYISKVFDYSQQQLRFLMMAVLSISVFTLTKIHHAATYGVFLSLVCLFVISNMTNLKGIGRVILVILLTTILFIALKSSITESVTTLTRTDIEVLQGSRTVEGAFHGRMGRWKRIWSRFSKEDSMLVKMFGVYLSGNERSVRWPGAGCHNDYLRITLLSGFCGIFLYLFFLFTLFRKCFFLQDSLRYLVLGALTVVLLYSVSLTPTVYMNLMYVVMTIFSYVASLTASRKIRGIKVAN